MKKKAPQLIIEFLRDRKTYCSADFIARYINRKTSTVKFHCGLLRKDKILDRTYLTRWEGGKRRVIYHYGIK